MKLSRYQIRQFISEAVTTSKLGGYKSRIIDMLTSGKQAEVNQAISLLTTMASVNPELRSIVEFGLNYFQAELSQLKQGPIDPQYGLVTQDLIDMLYADGSMHGRIDADRLQYVLRAHSPEAVEPKIKRVESILRQLESAL